MKVQIYRITLCNGEKYPAVQIRHMTDKSRLERLKMRYSRIISARMGYDVKVLFHYTEKLTPLPENY